MTTFLTKIFHRRRPRLSGWAVFKGQYMLGVHESRKKAEQYATRHRWVSSELGDYYVSKIKMYEI